MRIPFYDEAFTEIVCEVLELINGFPSIKTIRVTGRFSVRAVPDILYVHELDIEALSQTPNKPRDAVTFLQAFRNLKSLRIYLGGSTRHKISCASSLH